MALPPFLSSVIDWLRAGYPEGVPDVDYIPLFALLGSELTDADINAIADELAATGDPATAQGIRDAIARTSDEKPLDVDVARVRARLAAGGWPLARAGHLAPVDNAAD
ncbi:MAG TPA: DUF3349 domain-containing protein [Streptosporangiaceae bacterium]|jgi:Protein of unknown function (DUF3349)|nr:DUF3349 domain-containing protein [Streptosporangiaceae bacterium]